MPQITGTRRRTAAAVTLAVPATVLATLVLAAPAQATPSQSVVLANTFPVQCTANGASTVTGTLTVSAAGPATAAVGDTIVVSDYRITLALSDMVLNLSPFKGADPSFEVGGTFAGQTVLTGAMTLGPVTSTGSLQRAPLSSSGAVTLSGAGSAPISFTATAPGGVVVTSASPVKADLAMYLTKLTPAGGGSLPTGVPTPNPTTPYATLSLSCSGNPVLPWGTVQITQATPQGVAPSHLAYTGSRDTTIGVVGGWVLVAGVAISFAGRRRRTV